MRLQLGSARLSQGPIGRAACRKPAERRMASRSQARGRATHTILLTPQKNGSGPCVTPVTLVRHACCWRNTPSGA
jgi:hypothetical protein